MVKYTFLLLGLLVIVPTCWSVCEEPDQDKCEYSCGYSIGSDGCAQCNCSTHPHDEACPRLCPADCDMLRLDNGCHTCPCGGRQWFGKLEPSDFDTKEEYEKYIKEMENYEKERENYFKELYGKYGNYEYYENYEAHETH